MGDEKKWSRRDPDYRRGFASARPYRENQGGRKGCRGLIALVLFAAVVLAGASSGWWLS